MRRLPLLALAVFLPAAVAHAGWNERVPPVNNALTAKECGECHMAFQPALLPAESWGRMMDDLKNHFGDDASLPAAAVAEIRDYLTRNAGRGDGKEDRITNQRWFAKEHKFRVDLRKDDKIRSPANCVACHKDAARGLYEDD
jgi:hypothetical protein